MHVVCLGGHNVRFGITPWPWTSGARSQFRVDDWKDESWVCLDTQKHTYDMMLEVKTYIDVTL